MYSFSIKPPLSKKKMGLVHSIAKDQTFATVDTDVTEPLVKGIIQDKEQKQESKMGPALFTLFSTSKDIEYPTSNSILKTQNSGKSDVFTSELYESCVLSFSVVQIMDSISVGLNNNDKYYGIHFEKNKYRIKSNEAIESDIEVLPDETEFDYEIGDVFKIIHLSNEITIFKNELTIYTSKKGEEENDSYRALFTLSNKEDEIRKIQFYYIHQNRSNFLKQGSTIQIMDSVSNDVKISDGDSFYLLEGVPSVISGISKGKNGQHIIIINNSGNKQIFSDNDTDSLYENRLSLGGNRLEINNRESIQFIYVSDLDRWVLL